MSIALKNGLLTAKNREILQAKWYDSISEDRIDKFETISLIHNGTIPFTRNYILPTKLGGIH